MLPCCSSSPQVLGVMAVVLTVAMVGVMAAMVGVMAATGHLVDWVQVVACTVQAMAAWSLRSFGKLR